MRETEELADGTRIGRFGALWYLLDEGGDPVGRGYHAVEPAPVTGFYLATQGSHTFVVDGRGARVSAGYHQIEYVGDGEFRGVIGAGGETFTLPADASVAEEGAGDASVPDASDAGGDTREE